MAEAQKLEKDDPAAAEARLRKALALGPQDRAARVMLARVLLAQDRLDETEEQIKHLAEQGYLEPEAERIQAQCLLRQAARLSGDVAAARDAAVAAPQDMVAQMKLVYALAGTGQYAEALERRLPCSRPIERDSERQRGRRW